MTIRRVVPNLRGSVDDAVRDFYLNLLGFRIGMDSDSMLTFVSQSNETAQLSVIDPGAGEAAGAPAITIEVFDVDLVHSRALRRGAQIVYPLTDEPWGVRRFFVEDPNGLIINVMEHRPPRGGGRNPEEEATRLSRREESS